MYIHVQLCMYMKYIYNLHMDIRYSKQEAFYNSKYMVTNNPFCYTALTIRLSMIWPCVHL